MKRSSAGLWLLLAMLSLAAEAAAEPVRTYDPDPTHLWNRLHETLFVRIGPDGQQYGEDRLDPLLWGETRHLLTGDSHARALGILDEFIEKDGEKLIRDPLRRAFLQHDLWALFDWVTADPSGAGYIARNFAAGQKELQPRLVAIIRRLALTKDEIASLPDNYARALTNQTHAALPRQLFQRDGEWVALGAIDGAVAPRHQSEFGGRSIFQVLVRVPDGRAAALRYLEQLRSFDKPWVYVTPVPGEPESVERLTMNPALPQFPAGTQWALVRRMCVLDVDGRIQPTRLVESIQLRRYLAAVNGAATAAPQLGFAQQPSKFVASRLRNAELRQVEEGERDFFQFMAHETDAFEVFEVRPAAMPLADFDKRFRRNELRSCAQCHSGGGIQTVHSYTRAFGPRTTFTPRLSEVDAEPQMLELARWKYGQYDYGFLRGLWETTD